MSLFNEIFVFSVTLASLLEFDSSDTPIKH